jgi:hypothetical protein
MGVIVRKLNAAPSWVIDHAKRLGHKALKSGIQRSIMDGYIIQARKAGETTAFADVIDPPAKLLHCQPYLFALPGGSLATARWRQAVLPMGRDPLQVQGYKPLTYAVGPEPELTADDLRYRLFAGELYVGPPPASFAFLARGVYAPALDGSVVGTASIIGARDDTCWLSLYRMDSLQRMLRSNATDEQIAGLTGGERYESNVTLNEVALGADLFPDAPFSTHSSYTITPGYLPFDMRSGLYYAHTFTELDEPPDYATKHRADVLVGRYEVVGEYPDSRAVGHAEAIVSTESLPGLLEGCNLRLMRASTDTDGNGVLVAQAHQIVNYGTEEDLKLDTAWGCVAIPISAGLPGAPVAVRAGALFAGPDDFVYAYTPICGMLAGTEPVVACHRARIGKDGEDTLKQAAEDLALVIIDASGAETLVSLPGYHPVVYVNRLAAMTDGRITAGVWTFPVGSGDWSTYLVQSACQCGADEMAVLVRPAAQYADASTDYHVAIVRISTGEPVATGPAVMRGSRWMLASVTCMERGQWDGIEEVQPARLLATLFREAEAPEEPPESSLPGTYRLFESGRVCELMASYLTASLCYSLGSGIRPERIG